MTAVLPTAPAPAPVRRRLTASAWVLWRQYRAATLGVLGLFGAVAVLLLITGLPMHAAYRELGLDRCNLASDAGCPSVLDTFSAQYDKWGQLLPQLMQFLPALAGAFVGGPILAREYESGTFRFAWTQGTGRTRWTLTRLLVLGAGVTLAAQALSLLFAWWFAPWTALRGRFDSGGAFEVIGTVFAARALFAFTLGALFGVLLRRAVAAVVAALAGWFVVVLLAITVLRQHYQAPVVIALKTRAPTPSGPGTVAIRPGDWNLSHWMTDPAGHRLDESALNRLAQDLLSRGVNPGQWFAEHGYTTWQSYHPASRFWPFQLIETSWLVTLSLLLAAATIYLVKRR